MEKIFLDIGSHNGQTILKAIKKFPDCSLYIGIEPVSSLVIQSLKKIPSNYKQRVIIFNIALDALDQDFKYITFYEDIGPNKLGSSFLDDKQIRMKSENKVLCMDVVNFLKGYIFEGKEIIMKIDVEGKEYDILEKLIKTDILQNQVKRLFIEWHWHKTKSIPQTRHNQLVNDLNNIGFKVTGDSKKDQFYDGL